MTAFAPHEDRWLLDYATPASPRSKSRLLRLVLLSLSIVVVATATVLMLSESRLIAAAAQRNADEERKAEHQRVLDVLSHNATEYARHGQVRESLVVADQMLAIDPGNPIALELRELARSAREQSRQDFHPSAPVRTVLWME